MASYTKELTETLNLLDVRGESDEASFYIKNSTGQWEEYKDYEYFKVVKKQNQVSEFEVYIADIEASDKVFVKEFAEVLFLSEKKLILKGRIQKVAYETSYSCKITGFGMEAKLLDKEFDELSNTTATWSEAKRAQYTNASAQTIAKELLSSASDGAATWIMNPALDGIFLSDYGDTSIRFEYVNRLKALAGLTESLVDPTYQGVYEWGVSQSGVDDYSLDSFNMAPLIPTTTRATVSQETFAITGASANSSQTFYEKDITNLANKIDCYDEKTEVLTLDGFKFFKDVTFKDKIATLNPRTKELEYHYPTDIQNIRYKGEMLKFDSKQINLLVSPNHNLYTKKLHEDGDFYLCKPDNHFGKYLKMKKNCKWKGEKEKYFIIPEMIQEHITQDNYRGFRKRKRIIKWEEKKIPINLWLQFMGWYLSEGSLSPIKQSKKSGYKIDIRQYKKETLKEIYDLIKEMGFKPFLCKGRIQFYHKPLYNYLKQFGYAYNKYIPQNIKELDSESIKIFLKVLFRGDGCIKNNKLLSYYSTSKKLLDDVAECLLKVGLACKVYEKDAKKSIILGRLCNCRKSYELSVNYTQLNPQIKPSQMSKVNYNGMIYDVTVPNHILFVRRKGISLWSGNCLGYGDGVNQVHTSTFNASPTYSSLASDITASSTSIILADASDFASSGEIRIMEERITYSGKTSNTLTGCLRAANSTTARIHKKGVYLEKYIAVASAEANSSISDNGLMDYSVTDRGLLDLPTAELVASKILLERMTPITSIRVIPDEPLQTAGSRKIGDLVTVTDAEAGVDGDFRLVGMTYASDYGYLSLELELSNKTLNFIEQMKSVREEAEKLSKYMQGATNLYSIQSYENCDNTYPIYIRFYLPSDAIAINDVDLRFTTQKYRGYSSTTEVNSASSGVAASADNNSSVAITSNVWTEVASITTANTDCEGVFLGGNFDFVLNSGSEDNGSGYFKARISDGSNYYPDSDGQRFGGGYLWNDSPMLSGNISRYIPGNNKNKTYTLEVKWFGWSNDYDWTINTDLNYATFTRHTHNTGYAISEDTFPAGSPQVVIEVDDGAGGWTGVTGSPFSVADDGTYDADITSEVSNLGAGSWVTVRCTPQSGTDHNNLRVEANLNVKVFIQSRT